MGDVSKKHFYSEYSNGFGEHSVESWEALTKLVRETNGGGSNYWWRGQRSSAWPVESTYARSTKENQSAHMERALQTHLANFRKAARYILPRGEVSDEELWILGRHHGLATPYLDFTESPYIALMFAFESGEASETGWRALWFFHYENVLGDPAAGAVVETADVVRNANARLHAQQGRIVGLPSGGDLQTIVQNGAWRTEPILGKINVCDRIRDDVCMQLRDMAINPSSIYPDLTGAAEYANMAIDIRNYVTSSRSGERITR